MILVELERAGYLPIMFVKFIFILIDDSNDLQYYLIF